MRPHLVNRLTRSSRRTWRASDALPRLPMNGGAAAMLAAGAVLVAVACTPAGGRRAGDSAAPASAASSPPPPASASGAGESEAVGEARAYAQAHPGEVFAMEGRIYFSDPRGALVELTSGGQDKAPCLSPDRARVAFVRGEGNGAAPDEGLWIVGVDGKGAERLVAIEPDDPRREDPGHRICDITRPQFSPDGRTLFFQTWGWMVSRAVQTVDLASRRVRFVIDGSHLWVVPGGASAGRLLVARHIYEPSNRYEWWLVTPQGNLLRSLGVWQSNDDARLQEQLRR
jgi:hypothetical protein